MRNQHSPLSLQDRYDNLQIYCQEMREHVQDLEYELSQAHNELRYLHLPLIMPYCNRHQKEL